MNRTTSKARAFLCRRFPADIEAALHERYELHVNESDRILSAQEIVDQANGAEVLFVTATEFITAEVLHRLAPSLRYIATLSVGYDHVDCQVARELEIRVLHTPDVLSEACAEIAMMLMLNACRRGYEADHLVRSGKWQGWSPTQLLGQGLVGKRLGIFGMGRIGREVASRARAFGMSIHYHNRSRLPTELEAGATYYSDLQQLMAASEVFLIAAPGSASMKGVIDADHIACLPSQAVLINISRGDLLNDDALIAGLLDGRLFAAGLDVFANEPNIDPRYRELEQVFLSPHIGSATHETRSAMGWLLIKGLEQLFNGSSPDNLVPSH